MNLLCFLAGVVLFGLIINNTVYSIAHIKIKNQLAPLLPDH